MNTILLCLLITLSCSQPVANKSKEVNTSTRNYYGEWKVYKFYSPEWIIAAEENYMLPEQAKAFINKTAILQKSETSIFGYTCNTLNFDEYKENTVEYFSSNYRIVIDTITGKGTRGLHPKQLGIISDSIEVVEISCDESYYELFVLSSEEIMIEHKSTFFFLKRVGSKESKREDYSGTGSITKELTLTGKKTSLIISYEFYNDPDELVIYDQNGKKLHCTGMKPTTKKITENINLYDVTKLIFKIENKETNSKWKFSIIVK